jgi:hypothetical protein
VRECVRANELRSSKLGPNKSASGLDAGIGEMLSMYLKPGQ